MEKGLVFGLNIGELLEIYDHDSRSWKMSGCLFTGDYAKSWGPLPKSGIMRNGQIYQLQTSELAIRGKGFGLLPTPRASDYRRLRFKKETLQKVVTKNQNSGNNFSLSIPEIVTWKTGKSLKVSFVEIMMGYPKKWTDLKDSEMRLSLK